MITQKGCDCDGVTATCMHCDPTGEKWEHIRGIMRPYQVAHVTHLVGNYGSESTMLDRELVIPEFDEDSHMDRVRGFY